MMEAWERLFHLLRGKRASGARYFALDESLHTALVERAGQEQRPEADVGAEVIAAGLAHLQTADGLKERWETLSRREREVAAFACLGYTNRQMVGRLHISVETVKTHMKSIFRKLDAKSRLDAVMKAKHNGLID